MQFLHIAKFDMFHFSIWYQEQGLEDMCLLDGWTQVS